MHRTSLWRAITCLAAIPGLAFLIGYLMVRIFPGSILAIGVLLWVPLAAGALAPHLSRRIGIWAAAMSAPAMFAGMFVASIDQHAKLAAGYGWWFVLKGMAPYLLVAMVVALTVAIPVTLALRRGAD